MIISLVVAVDRSGGIGKDNQVPWHLSGDLKRFKALTMGHHIIMGRRTDQSIGKNLSGRVSVVITKKSKFQAEGLLVAHSLEEALQLARDAGENEVFIIGGGQIYELALPLADRIYLTQVDTHADCDVFFPEIDLTQWDETQVTFHPADDRNQYSYTIKKLEKTLT